MTNTEVAEPAQQHGRTCHVQRKVDRHLLPMLCWLGVVIALDSTSVSYARIEGMLDDVNIQPRQYSIAILLYFVAYIVADVPANILLLRTRPRGFLSTIVLLCGVVTICEGFTGSYAGFLVCRITLGLSQAAFYAGSILLIASYYPAYALHFRMSSFLACRLLASALSGLLAYGTEEMDGIAGYSAWRWLFIIEGGVTGVSAGLAFLALPPWPENATFLSPKEKGSLPNAGGSTFGPARWKAEIGVALKQVFKDPKVYFCGLIHFCSATGASSSAIFLPTILSQFGWTSLKAAYMSTPVYLFAFAVAVLNGIASDYTKNRVLFCVWPLVPAIIGFGLLLAGPEQLSSGTMYAALYMTTAGNFAAQAMSLTWLSNNYFDKLTRGIALGYAASIGSCGLILGSNAFLQDEKLAYPTMFGVSLATATLAIVLAVAHACYLARQSRVRRIEGKPVWQL